MEMTSGVSSGIVLHRTHLCGQLAAVDTHGGAPCTPAEALWSPIAFQLLCSVSAADDGYCAKCLITAPTPVPPRDSFLSIIEM